MHSLLSNKETININFKKQSKFAPYFHIYNKCLLQFFLIFIFPFQSIELNKKFNIFSNIFCSLLKLNGIKCLTIFLNKIIKEKINFYVFKRSWGDTHHNTTHKTLSSERWERMKSNQQPFNEDHQRIIQYFKNSSSLIDWKFLFIFLVLIIFLW